jgi:predicted acetyltransferase
MKRIKEKQKWDFHNATRYIYLDNDNIIGSFVVSYYDDWTKMSGLYIQPEYRGKGYFHKLMKDLMKEIKDPFFIVVRKGAWIIEEYKKYGFEWYSEDDGDDRFEFMFNEN